MNEKRVLTATILSALFLAGYSQVMSRWYGPSAQRLSREAAATAQTLTKEISLDPTLHGLVQDIIKEDVINIESRDMRLEIGSSSGAIRVVTLKKFPSSLNNSPIQFSDHLPLFVTQIGHGKISQNLNSITRSSATFNIIDSSNKNYYLLYDIDNDNPIIHIKVSSVDPAVSQTEILFFSSWLRGDGLSGRNNVLESVLLTDRGQGKYKHERHISPWRKEKIVPRGTSIVTLSERYFCSSLKPSIGTVEVSLIPSPDGTATFTARAIASPDSSGRILYSADLYIGPRDYFYLNRANFNQAIHVGAIGQIGLVFLMFLSFICKITGNYGVSIILFSCLISCTTAPFTLMSLKSMKKMQELKPQIDRIMSSNKEDPTRTNKEVIGLYKLHRVNPLSGCLPMLLQMPIFISLFQAISHFIELRGKSFLWIKDLSLPDRLAKLPFSLPVIGSDLNVLPLIMAGAMYIQTKISQGSATSTQTNQNINMMSRPMMSIIFGIMFYQFPAGLVIYWLTNSLMSMAWYSLVK